MDMDLHVDNPDWQQLLHQFEDDRRLLEEEESSLRRLAYRAISLSNSYLLRLLESLQHYTFNAREEVHFFKHLKPHFQSHVIFYSRLFKIETDRPPAIPAGIEAYYRHCLESLDQVYRDHRFIHEYLECGQTYLDDRLFFRPPADHLLAISGLHPPVDGTAPISYDHVVAELLAADLLRKHLLTTIADLDLPGREGGNMPKLTWTAPKAHFVELAYALYASKSFNNGKAQLKDIIEGLEIAFSIKSGNYHRIFQEILFRQSGYTVFQDRMKNDYVVYINKIEDKHIG